MLNMLWAGMMAAGIFWAAFHGNMGAVTNGLLDSAKEAVTLGVTMLGIMSFWCGILKIGERAVIRFLFPNLPDGHPAGKYIATNMIANMLGLGWAATPAGLKAMEELGKLEDERREEKAPYKRKNTAGQSSLARQSGTASNEMCTFLIVNISSLQLIPINMIAYRSQYGSVSPAAIAGPALLATIASTAAGITFCKVMDRKNVDF